MINEVLDIINESLKGLAPDQKVYGLAQTVIRVQGQERELLPGVVDKTGEIQYVGIDDLYSVIIYHKLNSIASTQTTKGVGDRPGDIQNNYSLSAFVYWDRKKYNKLPDELLLVIQARLPIIVKGLHDTKMLRIKPTGAITNSLQVFSQEYQGAKFNLPANANLMRIDYTLESTFNPDCLKDC